MKLARVIPWTSKPARAGFAMASRAVGVIVSLGIALKLLSRPYSGQERLDGREDGGHVGRFGECAIRGDGLLHERSQRGGVARLHRVDGQRRSEHLRALDRACLPEIRGCAEVLDGVGEPCDL